MTKTGHINVQGGLYVQPDTKVGGIAIRAHAIAARGVSPTDAWIESLEETYSSSQLQNQLQHSCPKWTFGVLCNQGVLRDVPAGSCEASDRTRSGEFTLRALELIREDRSLLVDKRELKRRVFGSPGSPGYRTPNHEVEVLLGLWQAELLLV